MKTLQVRRFSLAQAVVNAPMGHIIVVDAQDRPVSDAEVSANGLDGRTNGRGIYEFPLPATTSVTITVRVGDYAVRTVRPAAEVETGAYVKIPVCLAQPIVTSIEIGALAVGIGCALAGVYWKAKPAEVIGEVLIGAAAFTAIYRHSCL